METTGTTTGEASVFEGDAAAAPRETSDARARVDRGGWDDGEGDDGNGLSLIHI